MYSQTHPVDLLDQIFVRLDQIFVRLDQIFVHIEENSDDKNGHNSQNSHDNSHKNVRLELNHQFGQKRVHFRNFNKGFTNVFSLYFKNKMKKK